MRFMKLHTMRSWLNFLVHEQQILLVARSLVISAECEAASEMVYPEL